jgi:hypothetical protein
MNDHVVYHVQPTRTGWEIQREGTEKALRAFLNKNEAKDWAIKEAKKATFANVVIHNKDLSVEEELTYGVSPVHYEG